MPKKRTRRTEVLLVSGVEGHVSLAARAAARGAIRVDATKMAWGAMVMAAAADHDARTTTMGRAMNDRAMTMGAPGMGPQTTRASVREGHPRVAKDGAAIAIVGADITPSLDRAAAGRVAADVSDGSVSAVTSFGIGSGEKSDKCHGGDREEFVNHVVLGVMVTDLCDLTGCGSIQGRSHFFGSELLEPEPPSLAGC